jgi:hypothetical protein
VIMNAIAVIRAMDTGSLKKIIPKIAVPCHLLILLSISSECAD